MYGNNPYGHPYGCTPCTAAPGPGAFGMRGQDLGMPGAFAFEGPPPSYLASGAVPRGAMSGYGGVAFGGYGDYSGPYGDFYGRLDKCTRLKARAAKVRRAGKRARLLRKARVICAALPTLPPLTADGNIAELDAELNAEGVPTDLYGTEIGPDPMASYPPPPQADGGTPWVPIVAVGGGLLAIVAAVLLTSGGSGSRKAA